MSLPKCSHNDAQDTAALAIPPVAGILGAVATLFAPKPIENLHVEIPREQDIFKPTKSMLDILSEQNERDMTKYMTEFGEQNGYPVIFVATIKNFDPPKEDIVHEAIITKQCDVKLFKRCDMHAALDFARRNGGELGIFDPRSKDEQIKDLEEKVKGLEDDRDYWKRKAEGDDGDTLGIFKHWND